MFGISLPGILVEVWIWHLLPLLDLDEVPGRGVRFAKLSDTRRTMSIFEALKRQMYNLNCIIVLCEVK